MITDQKKALGLKLKEIRESERISKYELNKRGVNYRVASNIEGAKSNYTINSLLEYCDALGVNIFETFKK